MQEAAEVGPKSWEDQLFPRAQGPEPMQQQGHG
jgi:hypothetical protein